jgi:hypothetical protein
MVSVFNTVTDTNNPSHVNVDVILSRIKSGGSHKDAITLMRAMSKDDFSERKRKLPVICFGGTFSKRNRESLMDASGLMVLDFDHVENIQEKRHQLYQLPFVYSVFLSPSGEGLKALIRIPKVGNDSEYKSYFLGISQHIEGIDPSGKDISRACFFSYDPDIYVNTSATNFTEIYVEKPKVEEPVTGTDYSKINIAVQMVRNSVDGEKHATLLKASRLMGGYIAINKIMEEDAIRVLEQEIMARNPRDFTQAQKTIRDGLDYGKRMPISETKKIERENRFIKEEDGRFSFIANDKEMDTYISDFIGGRIEMGLPTHLPSLDAHFRLKRNTFLLVAGIDNTGKSVFVWYLATIAAMFHNWKFAIFSSENKDGQIKKKIMEFYLGKSITFATADEFKMAHDFFRDHFRIISSSKTIYSCRDVLDMGEVLYDQAWGKFECLIIDPYNSLKGGGDYKDDYTNLSEIRLFAQSYASVWVCAHIQSGAARNRDSEGYIRTPSKADIEGGQPFANRADDMIIYHRLTNHPELWMYGQVNVVKVKDTETGGRPTRSSDPIMVRANKDQCGFACEAVDPVADAWNTRRAMLAAQSNRELLDNPQEITEEIF